MPSIQSLKKELRGIRSTQKLTKAMRTVSAAKFSKLNAAYAKYSEYGRQCKAAFDAYQEDFLEAVPVADPFAPPAFLVMASNKGLCGSFNAEVFKFARDQLAGVDSYLLFACGKKAIRYFKSREFPLEKGYLLRDVPSYEESGAVLDEILNLRNTGRVSGIYVIYPKYTNMLNQEPVVCELFPGGGEEASASHSRSQSSASHTAEGKERKRRSREADKQTVCVPDRRTMVACTAETLFRSMFYQLVLETALGAQAATLMTMRTAYDAATEFCAQLEGEINRKRQGAVTADVIETSSGEAALQGKL